MDRQICPPRSKKSQGQNYKPCEKHLLCFGRYSHCVKRRRIRACKISGKSAKKTGRWKSGIEKTKLEFFKIEVVWLGHNLSESGVNPNFPKTEPISGIKPPKSLQQLRSFLRSINHLSKNIRNAASPTKFLTFTKRKETKKI